MMRCALRAPPCAGAGAAQYLAEIGQDSVPGSAAASNKGSSQYRGVSWHERSQRWEVRVWGGGKQHFIGERRRGPADSLPWPVCGRGRGAA